MAKGRGGSQASFDPSTTPSLRDTPPVPGGELFLLLLQSPLQYLPLDLFKRPSLAEMFNGFCERGGKANDCCVINTPLLEQEGWPKAGVVVRRVVRSIYHPVAARHPL